MKNLSVIALFLFIGTFTANCSKIHKQEISWKSTDGTHLVGTLLLPENDVKSLVILIHGSGNISRELRWYEVQAKKFVEMGLAVLYYDKRGTGGSGGDWKTVDMNQLADDALTAIPGIKKIERMKSTNVGLVGYSQGGWIMLKALERSKQIDFLISVSGSTQTPGEQGKYVTRNQMQKNGFSQEKISHADSLNEMINQVYLSDKGWEEAREALDNSDSDLKRYIGIQPYDSWNWKWYASLPLDYDPRPTLQSLQVPMLALHGTLDPLVDASTCVEYLESLKSRGLNIQNYTDPKGSHILKFKKKHMFFWMRSYWKEEYYQVINNWLNEQELK